MDGTDTSGGRVRLVVLGDAANRSVRTMSGAATILEALALCGDLGHDKGDALLLVASALDSASEDVLAAETTTSNIR